MAQSLTSGMETCSLGGCIQFNMKNPCFYSNQVTNWLRSARMLELNCHKNNNNVCHMTLFYF